MNRNFDDYKSSLPCPTQADFTTYHLYGGGEVLLKNAKKDDVIKYVSDKFKCKISSGFDWLSDIKKLDCVIESVVDKQGYAAAKEIYVADQRRLVDLFKTHCFEDFGLTNNPFRDKIYSYAYSKGHASGYHEIYNMFYDLVDIFQDSTENEFIFVGTTVGNNPTVHFSFDDAVAAKSEYIDSFTLSGKRINSWMRETADVYTTDF